jgi:hypothetical protein
MGTRGARIRGFGEGAQPAVLNSGLMKNAHLRRYRHSSSLRRTSVYASLLGISGALHLNVFDEPVSIFREGLPDMLFDPQISQIILI